MRKDSTVYTIGFMIALCIVFGAAVSSVHFLTDPLLTQNEKAYKYRIIGEAFNLSTADTRGKSYEETVNDFLRKDTLTNGNLTFEVYTGKEGNSIGFIFRGAGFWDMIEGIIILSPDLSAIRNIRFLSQKETPGLGARIEETYFTDQFIGLRIDWNKPKSQRIIIDICENKTANNCIDAITGATQTSTALMNLLNSELELFRQTYKNGKRLNSLYNFKL